MEEVDLLIVGAGWHGLSMARTYLSIKPGETLRVVDSAATIGGVWSAERLYSTLHTNNPIGAYEFNDHPMDPEKYGCKPGQNIPGTVVHRYLCDVADASGVSPFFQPRTKVEVASLQPDYSWIVEVSVHGGSGDVQKSKIHARRLVLATGLTSEPSMPSFAGQESFQRPLMHAKELKSNAAILSTAEEVVVIGGNKSAFDAAHMAAQRGARVHMCMRPSGGGPSYVWPNMFPFLGNLSAIALIASTRFFTWFDPCLWAGTDGSGWIRAFLHRTWFGRKLCGLFWDHLTGTIRRINDYDAHPGTKFLRPWVSVKWVGNSVSVNNYSPSWFEVAKQGKIKVHIAEVTSLSDGTVHLSTGESLKADALVCCTGWKAAPPIRFAPEGLEARLGLPSPSHGPTDETREIDRSIYARFPELREGPQRNLPSGAQDEYNVKTPLDSQQLSRKEQPLDAYRLYRFMVPADAELLRHRTFAAIGAHISVWAVVLAQIQALWITAYFAHDIANIQSDDMTDSKVGKLAREALTWSRFGRLRHPPSAGGLGERFPDLLFESIPYADVLIKDLGLKFKRKATWRQELFSFYSNDDYRGLIDEWKAARSL